MTRRLRFSPLIFFPMASERLDDPPWICEASHCGVSAVHRSPMKKQERVSVVRLVRVPPFSVLVVNGDSLHAGSA